MHIEGNLITQDQLEEIIAMAKPCNLKGARLYGANLAGANLEGANLEGVNLKGVNLAWVNLEGAYLKDANLEGVNLKDANLEGVNLKDANLAWVNLDWVNLAGANLTGANLEGVNLKGVNLEGAKGIMSLSIPGMSSRGDTLYIVRHVGGLMVKFEYFYGDLEEFEQHVQENYGSGKQAKLYAAVIQLLHVWGTVRE